MAKETRNQILRWAAVIALFAAAIAGAAVLSRGTASAGGNTVRISEVLASNSAYPAPDGSYPDFIELFNAGRAEVDLSGCGLTDNGRLVKYVFPEGTVLPAGGYLVVWCDSASTNESYAAFSIAKDGGETLALLNRHGVAIDSAETVPAVRNQSMVRDGDGFVLSDCATPGFENSERGYAAYLASRDDAAEPVHLSEFMSSNSLYPTPDGLFSDWIELFNGGSADVDLCGYSLSDTEEEPKFTFAEHTVLPAGDYLLLLCGDGGLGFSLASAGGEVLCFLSPEGKVIDRVETPALEKDTSYAWIDGAWTLSAPATPGFENSEAGYAQYLSSLGLDECTVVFTEVMAENRSCITDAEGDFGDWIELYNNGAEPQALGGFWLSDDPADPLKWRFPDVTLQPEQYLLVFCDGKNAVIDGELHTGFSLSRYGETVTLSTPAGSAVTALSYETLDADRSLADGTVTDAPSPGYPNNAAGIMAFLASRADVGPLVINEVMSSNDRWLRQPDGQYYDWAEIKNVSDESVLLSDYTLTDDPDEPERYRFPDLTLAPGENYVVILCGTAALNGDDHAHFSLNAQEDWLYLCDARQKAVDFVHVYGLPYLGSIGRTDGEAGFFCFATPTPGKDNGSGARGVAPAPLADAAPGAYDGVETLTVRLSGPEAEGAEIRYTTNGSVPTASSTLYEGPIELTATTILRARCFVPGALSSDTTTLSYFLNEGHTLPIVSLVAEPSDIFGPQGIYVRYYADMEKYANVSFFEDGGSFSQDCGLTMYGSGSRETNEKKSFNLLFRPRYGTDGLDYPLYGETEVSHFSSLVLRAGEDYPFAIIREELMTSLAHDASDSLLTQLYRHCVLYINGQFWGIYSLKEHFTPEYYAAHHDVTPESVTVLRVSRVYGSPLYTLMRWAIAHDLSVEENYRYVEENVDLESLADWVIFQAYCGNSDIQGNIRYLQSTEDGGRWHYAFYDLDWSLRSHGNITASMLKPGEQYSMIPRALFANSDFRAYFLERLAFQLQNALSDENVLQRIDALCAAIRPEVERERAFWGGSVQSWDFYVARMRDFVSKPGRDKEVIDDFCSYLHVSAAEKEHYFAGMY